MFFFADRIWMSYLNGRVIFNCFFMDCSNGKVLSILASILLEYLEHFYLNILQ